MRFGSSDVEGSLLRLSRSERLGAVERVVILAIIVAVIALDVFGIFFTPGVSVAASLLSIVSTAVFGLYLWPPLGATCGFGVIFGLSFLTGTEVQVLTASALAAILVMRLRWASLLFSYIAVFIVAVALVAYGGPHVLVNVGFFLILAIVAGAIGFMLRIASARGRRLEKQLAEQERQAVLAERRWIAGELHDSIAHHLTVVALHVQMLDDFETSRDSQEAIRVAAHKAIADLRFVIEIADNGPRSSSMQTRDLEDAMDEARRESESAGHPVHIDGDPRDERISRAVEIVLARIMRESATNVLKYAGSGEVVVDFRVDDESTALTIRSPLPARPRRELSSSRTGLGRMAERVLGASGQFSAVEDDERWVVSARLPIA